MTPNKKLLERLRKENGLKIHIDTKIERTYYHKNGQLDAGCWRWFIVTPLNIPQGFLSTDCLGSQWRVTDLLKSEKLIADWRGFPFNSYDIYPDDTKKESSK